MLSLPALERVRGFKYDQADLGVCTAVRGIKLDFAEAPEPQATTAEGFRDWLGVASFGDDVLHYPREAPLLRQYRPASEVLSDAAIASLKGKPVVNGHPTDGAGRRIPVTPENAKQFTCGVVLDAWREDDKIRVRVRVWDAQLLADIDAGKVDLSVASQCDTIPRRGVSPRGVEYDAVQCNYDFNHLAFEPRGRSPGARITADGIDTMTLEELLAAIKNLSPEDQKKLLAGIPGGKTDPPPEPKPGSGAIEERVAALEAAVAASMKADGVEVSIEQATAKVVEAATTAVVGNVRNIAAARNLATPILGGAKADGMDDANAIHRDVVIAVFPEMKADADDLFASGNSITLASLAKTARAQHNKLKTDSAADYIDQQRGKPAADLDTVEKQLLAARAAEGAK